MSPQLVACRTPIDTRIRSRWQRIYASLDNVIAGCQEAQVPLALVVVPGEFQVNAELRETLLRRSGLAAEQLRRRASAAAIGRLRPASQDAADRPFAPFAVVPRSGLRAQRAGTERRGARGRGLGHQRLATQPLRRPTCGPTQQSPLSVAHIAGQRAGDRPVCRAKRRRKDLSPSRLHPVFSVRRTFTLLERFRPAAARLSPGNPTARGSDTAAVACARLWPRFGGRVRG